MSWASEKIRGPNAVEDEKASGEGRKIYKGGHESRVDGGQLFSEGQQLK
jgi:hypothetical protein